MLKWLQRSKKSSLVVRVVHFVLRPQQMCHIYSHVLWLIKKKEQLEFTYVFFSVVLTCLQETVAKHYWRRLHQCAAMVDSCTFIP